MEKYAIVQMQGEKMETINGTKIRLERLTNEELETLKEHVLRKLDEVMEDHALVMDEINKRTQEYQDPLEGFLEQLDGEVQQTITHE